jgi:hypothetical protein
MATDSIQPQSSEHVSALTPPQVFWLTAQTVFFAGAVAWQWLANPEAMQLFGSDATGNQLAVAALLLLLANFACQLGGFWGLNRLRAHGRVLLRQLLLALLCVGSLLLLYLPALFTLVIGPSAPHIRTIMLQP